MYCTCLYPNQVGLAHNIIEKSFFAIIVPDFVKLNKKPGRIYGPGL